MDRNSALHVVKVTAAGDLDAAVAALVQQQVAAVILATPLPAPMRLLVPAHRLATARLLPSRLRCEYHLQWTGLHEFALPLAGGAVRYGATPVLRIAARLRPPNAKRYQLVGTRGLDRD